MVQIYRRVPVWRYLCPANLNFIKYRLWFLMMDNHTMLHLYKKMLNFEGLKFLISHLLLYFENLFHELLYTYGFFCTVETQPLKFRAGASVDEPLKSGRLTWALRASLQPTKCTAHFFLLPELQTPTLPESASIWNRFSKLLLVTRVWAYSMV